MSEFSCSEQQGQCKLYIVMNIGTVFSERNTIHQTNVLLLSGTSS